MLSVKKKQDRQRSYPKSVVLPLRLSGESNCSALPGKFLAAFLLALSLSRVGGEARFTIKRSEPRHDLHARAAWRRDKHRGESGGSKGVAGPQCFCSNRDEKWTSHELEIKLGSSQASADVPKLAAGFTAFLAEGRLTAPTGRSGEKLVQPPCFQPQRGPRIPELLCQPTRPTITALPMDFTPPLSWCRKSSSPAVPAGEKPFRSMEPGLDFRTGKLG